MKKRKNVAAKIMAAIALFAIVIGIVGTWVIVIFQTLGGSWNQEITEAELQEYLDSLSWSVDVQSFDINEENTWEEEVILESEQDRDAWFEDKELEAEISIQWESWSWDEVDIIEQLDVTSKQE